MMRLLPKQFTARQRRRMARAFTTTAVQAPVAYSDHCTDHEVRAIHLIHWALGQWPASYACWMAKRFCRQFPLVSLPKNIREIGGLIFFEEPARRKAYMMHLDQDGNTTTEEIELPEVMATVFLTLVSRVHMALVGSAHNIHQTLQLPAARIAWDFQLRVLSSPVIDDPDVQQAVLRLSPVVVAFRTWSGSLAVRRALRKISWALRRPGECAREATAELNRDSAQRSRNPERERVAALEYQQGLG